jgi:hypothetical protein
MDANKTGDFKRNYSPPAAAEARADREGEWPPVVKLSDDSSGRRVEGPGGMGVKFKNQFSKFKEKSTFNPQNVRGLTHRLRPGRPDGKSSAGRV